MDICVISPDCVRLRLTADECGRMGVSYEEFSPDSVAARLFVAAALDKLTKLGIVSERPQKLTAEVFEDGGGLAVYISGRGLSCRADETDDTEPAVLLLKDPAEVQAAAIGLPAETRAELWSVCGRYALVGQGLAGGRRSGVLAAAIKEHGRLLSDAPDTLFDDI